jgi:hypothetical protein
MSKISFSTASGKSVFVYKDGEFVQFKGVFSFNYPFDELTTTEVFVLGEKSPRVIASGIATKNISIGCFVDRTNAVHQWLINGIHDEQIVVMKVMEGETALFMVSAILVSAPVTSSIDSADRASWDFIAKSEPVFY